MTEQMKPGLPAIEARADFDFGFRREVSPSLQVLMNDKLFDRARQVAGYMSKAEGVVPKHLIGKMEACFAVLNTALDWKLSPWLVAKSTYQTPNGSIGYMGTLCQAILENSGMLEGPVMYEHHGDWQRLVGKFKMKTSAKGNEYPAADWKAEDEIGLYVIVKAKVRGEAELRTYRFDLVQAYPRNSTLWATDPRTQISYTAVRRFANLAAPGIFMGVPFDREEWDEDTRARNARDVTPPRRPSSADVAPQPEPEDDADKFDMADEVGTIYMSCPTAADWITELLARTGPTIDGAYTKQALGQLLANADATTNIIPECQDDALVAKLQARYAAAEEYRAQNDDETTSAAQGQGEGPAGDKAAAAPDAPAGAATGSAQAGGAAAGHGSDSTGGRQEMTSAPTSNEKPASAAAVPPATEAQPPEPPGPMAFPTDPKTRRPSAQLYLVALQDEMLLATQPEHIDILLAREQPNLQSKTVTDRTRSAITYFANRCKANIAAKGKAQ